MDLWRETLTDFKAPDTVKVDPLPVHGVSQLKYAGAELERGRICIGLSRLTGNRNGDAGFLDYLGVVVSGFEADRKGGDKTPPTHQTRRNRDSNQREPTKDSHLESALIRNGTRYGQLSPIRTCSDLGHPENSYTEDINDNTSGNWYSFVNVNGMGKSRSAGVGWLRSPGCVRLLILMVVIDSGCGQSPDDQTLGSEWNTSGYVYKSHGPVRVIRPEEKRSDPPGLSFCS
ncbi:hypothetical protein LSH36_327g03018 [Paralvinella palmiformis]|uniref:Uncharacterized protein n=1 Tax=Paralvinella palmiformis TaxID=53620 RepID=A0AAD9N335_9ANNE|nr:hypothetical protein LSH36_327g03018 [Paralvinella palmiformis]